MEEGIGIMNAKRELNQVGRANKVGRIMQICVVAVLSICYFLQASKDGISTMNRVLIQVALWVPVVLASVIYFKKPNSGIIKHFIGVGYGIFYILACFVSDQQLVYTYAFPMLLAVAIYMDKKFSILVASAISVIAIGHAVKFTVDQFKAAELLIVPELVDKAKDIAVSAMEIEIASTLFICVYSIISNNFIIKIMHKNMNTIEDSNSKTEKMLSSVMNVSGTLVKEVSDVSEKMVVLSNSSDEMMAAMDEVTKGTADTVEAVQNQLVKTSEIQKQITNVTRASKDIDERVNESVNAINEGRANVDKLIKHSEISKEAGNEVAQEVQVLKEYANQMENIVLLIQNVASETSLLALNASIEAARAGDAGKGFAVVATEINNLASQTASATTDIGNLILNITNAMDGVTDSISSLIESNRIQNESAKHTASSFGRIAESTSAIQYNSANLTSIVKNLDTANKEIVESIQTISAITEEVSAHSMVTCEKTETNMAIVDEVQSLVTSMTTSAEQLKNI